MSLHEERRQAVIRGIQSQAEHENVNPAVLYQRLRTPFLRDWRFWLAIALVILGLCSCGRLCVFAIPVPQN